MYAHRIKVLHVADNDTVVIRITHNLVLYFFHASNTLLNQTLSDWAVTNSGCNSLKQFFLICTNSPACSPQGVSRANDYRIPDFIGKINSFFNGRDDVTIWDRLLQFTHEFTEQITVFGFLN
ncbi:hypothetical protein D3C81_1279100 [compost metagenome]